MKHPLLLWLLFLVALLPACSKAAPTAAPLAVSGTTVPVTPTFTPAFTPTFTTTPPQPTDTPTPSITATPTGAPSPTSPPPTVSVDATSTVAPPTPETGPLPSLLAEIALAPADETIQDLLLDHATGRLYVTDTAGQLHVLDADTYVELATLPAAGNLTLDVAHDRLYVWHDVTWNDEGSITIVDTASLAVVRTILPGGIVALDSARNRFYVGRRVSAYWPDDTPGVRLYDGETLQLLAEGPQPGTPVYNPLRDELYIVALTVHQADPETLQVTGDLLPDITAQHEGCRGCTGLRMATGARVFPDHNRLMVNMTTISTGGGPGYVIGPRFFDATTLEEITDPVQQPAVQVGCGDTILAEPVNGRTYRDERYVRYVAYNNLYVYGPDGRLETWRDGLWLGITNPNTGQMYMPRYQDLPVLDLATLSPLGTLSADCIHTLDVETGRIYALHDRNLLVFSERGAWPDPPPTGGIEPLPAENIIFIQLSPDYDGITDQTIFLGVGDSISLHARWLYRSSDGGQTWTRLRGGLPEGDYLSLDLTISPSFTDDRTLFVGGFRGDSWGEGVYRSTDGGDTWQPMWNGLTHLRIQDVALSPHYAQDGTLLAYTDYRRLTPWESGDSIFCSTDQGLSWTLVMTTGSSADPLPPLENLLPPGTSPPDVQFRRPENGWPLWKMERTTDGGQTWEPITVTRQPDFAIQAILPSPNLDADGTVYVLAEHDLFRSTDAGDTWQRWRDKRLAGRDFGSRLTSGAITPLLDDGQHQLFIGTAAGEFWTLDPATLDWEPVVIAPQWPTVMAGEWVNEIEIAPDGDVWLGTWGDGLARYADGTIQARYTVTDGLPSQFIGGIAVASDGAAWVGSDLPPSVASFDGQTWTPHPFAEEDYIGGVRDVTIGPDGTVWVGSQTPGVQRWNGQAWDKITDPEHRIGYWTHEVEIGPGGTLWCATTSGLAYYKDGIWSGGDSGEVLGIEFGSDGSAYLLGWGGYVWRLTDGQWTSLPAVKKGYFLSPLVLHAAADGAVWLGTSEGIFRYNGQTWQQFTAQDGLPDNKVTAIAEDADGWLWFGTGDGAVHIDPTLLGLDPVVWLTPSKPTPTPETCALPPAEPFAAAYADEAVAARLACPVAEATHTWTAFQPFERGFMFWRADLRNIYVLHADGWWSVYDDTWDESQPTDDPSLTPPEGFLQPVRGFGKLWREQLGGPQAQVGWALEPEQGYEMLLQPFGGGEMFLGIEGQVFIFYTDRTWESRES
jgi:photosystem II stability/assembly factor-like uncharacterized protein